MLKWLFCLLHLVNAALNNRHSSSASHASRLWIVQDGVVKGNGDEYTLAIWSADGYAYSIGLSNGISELEWYDFISEV